MDGSRENLIVRPKPKRFRLSHRECRAISVLDGQQETRMLTLCIRYTLDAGKLADFETYARALQSPIERCGGKHAGYYLPTKIAGPTNTAMGFIDFPSLAAYETYREKLAADPDGIACLRQAEAAGCILIEDRSFLRRIPE
jgi:hypothetical protein